jgi:ribosomal protein L16 Arg81 hydroxylase
MGLSAGYDGSMEPSEGSMLSRCLPGVDLEEFAGRYWGREPYVAPSVDPRRFRDLITLDGVDEAMRVRGLRVRVVDKDQVVRADAEYTNTVRGFTGLDMAKVSELYMAGGSLHLVDVCQSWAPLYAVSAALTKELSCRARAQVFAMSSAAEAGLVAHYDSVGVILMQIEGRKRWRLYAPPKPLPLDGFHNYARFERELGDLTSGKEPLLDIVLEPGQAFYLPRGFVHENAAVGDRSLHVSFTLREVAWHDALQLVVQDAVKAAAEDEAFRHTLPLGFLSQSAEDKGALEEAFKGLVARFQEGLNAEGIHDLLVRDQLVAGGACVRLADLERLDAGVAGPGARYRVHSDCAFRFEREGEKVSVRLQGNRVLRLGAAAEEPLAFVLGTGGEAFVLADVPGPLSDDDKGYLLHKLVELGLLGVEPPGESTEERV